MVLIHNILWRNINTKELSGQKRSYHSKLNESMYTEESISGKGQEYAIVSFSLE